MSARTPSPLTETVALIGPGASAEDGAAIHVDDEDHDEAVPWKSIFPMVLYRIVDAATYLLIFPFIAELLLSLDADPARVGLYAGIAEGSLMLSEAVFAPVWAKSADRYGRRPVLVLGFMIPFFPAVLVGFSTKVWHIIGLRALGESLLMKSNPSVCTIRVPSRYRVKLNDSWSLALHRCQQDNDYGDQQPQDPGEDLLRLLP